MSIPALRVSFHTAKTTDEDWQIIAFTLSEEMSRPYSLTLEVEPREKLRGHKLLGSPCTLTLSREGGLKKDSRVLHGIVTSWQEVDRAGPALSVRLQVGPAALCLDQRRNSAVFLHMSAQEIVTKVAKQALQPFGRQVAFDLAAEPPKRELCIQYEETDGDFIHRLLNEEGLEYFFDQTGRTELLTAFDDNRFFCTSPQAPALRDLPMAKHDGRYEENITSFTYKKNARPTNFFVRTYDWTRPDGPFEHHEHLPANETYSAPSYHVEGTRHYAYDGVEYAANSCRLQGRVLAEQEQTKAFLGTGGTGSVLAFTPGSRFTLQGHQQASYDATYLVTQVTHTCISLRLEGAILANSFIYSNSFRCQPLETPYRSMPRQKPPQILGLQSAKVVGPPGESVWADRHGRVRIQFPWDRDHRGEEARALWARVSQSWAGSRFGTHFLPRVGMEVLVAFAQGNPDRPIVIGSVHNGANAPPFDPRKEKSRAGIRSRSFPASYGYNELSFDDRAGEEQLTLHAERDFNTQVRNDHTTEVGGDAHTDVAGDLAQNIGGAWQSSAKELTLSGANGCILRQGGASIAIKNGSIQLTGATILINGIDRTLPK